MPPKAMRQVSSTIVTSMPAARASKATCEKGGPGGGAFVFSGRLGGGGVRVQRAVGAGPQWQGGGPFAQADRGSKSFSIGPGPSEGAWMLALQLGRCVGLADCRGRAVFSACLFGSRANLLLNLWFSPRTFQSITATAGTRHKPRPPQRTYTTTAYKLTVNGRPPHTQARPPPKQSPYPCGSQAHTPHNTWKTRRRIKHGGCVSFLPRRQTTYQADATACLWQRPPLMPRLLVDAHEHGE